jgi:hypothetical protein
MAFERFKTRSIIDHNNYQINLNRLFLFGWKFAQYFKLNFFPKIFRPKWSFVKSIPGRAGGRHVQLLGQLLFGVEEGALEDAVGVGVVPMDFHDRIFVRKQALARRLREVPEARLGLDLGARQGHDVPVTRPDLERLLEPIQ